MTKIKYRAHLLVELTRPVGQCPTLPSVKQVVIASQGATAMSVGLWAELLSVESTESFEVAKNEVRRVVAALFPFLLPWLPKDSEGMVTMLRMKASPTF